MYDTVYNLILSAKYLCVAVLMFALPSETVMPIVGYVASLGHIWLIGAIAMGVIGTTLWALMIYAIARWVGPAGLDVLIGRYGTLLGIRKSSVDTAGKWFDRHAGLAICLGRFVPGLRTAVCVPAGLRRMPVSHFLGYCLLGSAVDGVILAYLGYTAHSSFHELRVILDSASNVIVITLVALVLGWWLLRRR
jgi:membrane protein DedA with SNARE-associated domain